MARIAYVDHSYHKKTVSTKFLPELLCSRGHSVDFFWDEKWQGGDAVDFLSVSDYDVIIMFQSFCKLENGGFFSKLHNNVVYIPMLDQFGLWRGPIDSMFNFWRPFQGCKVLNFSTAAHGMTVGMGIRSKLIRFYKKPIQKQQRIEGLHGFLWIRLEDEISWQLVKKLIKNSSFNSFHLHIATDPNSSKVIMPSKEDILKYNITISNWFEDKNDFELVLNKANVFFAPRMEEGIGQSFLEALSRGQCIVAPNNGTMNEYIQDGYNGILYDCEAPEPIDLTDIENITKNAYESSKCGYKKWVDNQDKILNYILMSNKDAYKGKYNFFDNIIAEEKPKLKIRLKSLIKSKLSKIPHIRRLYSLYKGNR